MTIHSILIVDVQAWLFGSQTPIKERQSLLEGTNVVLALGSPTTKLERFLCVCVCVCVCVG